ncbi:MAG: hypothetical protein G01um101448_272 [Parcubacteria group bacterium Gr01-1014_48]|nr:MAG: hypothetical protein Greene041614_292 [Parcubacteria group bacterium Greene0416_14]TSC74221.1 MAG: hypothetical protein G01um101448_272 [Parcubacteria group bacterium Gr01-1014_48]TSD01725.1 MAG: hypothetical protein Greene101415_123 [Parcubacteria group bacterium Greene1014_15]TSD07795.1 MAG: hypothetical protein Greene07144_720 [Parcubacteria group bacterium Greene0714_4]
MAGSTILVIAGIFAVLTLNSVFFMYMLRRNKGAGGDTSEEREQSLMLLQNQMMELSRALDDRLREGSRTMNESLHNQFSESQHLVQNIHRQMTDSLVQLERRMSESQESSKQVLSIAEQLRNLEKVLKHQKQRGNLGEASLQLVLENMLSPEQYTMQYGFANGDVVDAVIYTKEGCISIDAKFSLDNYNRVVNEQDELRRLEYEKEFKNDLKKRIDETAKYIRTEEGTLPFAFMFIPAEGIYYDLLVNEVGAVKSNTRSLIDYAYQDKHVIIVSPTTFTAYLQSVLYGFRAFKIEQQAMDIRTNVEKLGRHISAYDELFKKLGSSLGTTVNHYNSAYKELHKIDKDVYRIAGTEAGIETLALDRPMKEELD